MQSALALHAPALGAQAWLCAPHSCQEAQSALIAHEPAAVAQVFVASHVCQLAQSPAVPQRHAWATQACVAEQDCQEAHWEFEVHPVQTLPAPHVVAAAQSLSVPQCPGAVMQAAEEVLQDCQEEVFQ